MLQCNEGVYDSLAYPSSSDKVKDKLQNSIIQKRNDNCTVHRRKQVYLHLYLSYNSQLRTFSSLWTAHVIVGQLDQTGAEREYFGDIFGMQWINCVTKTILPFFSPQVRCLSSRSARCPCSFRYNISCVRIISRGRFQREILKSLYETF